MNCLVLLFAAFAYVVYAKSPSYIKACSKSDANINKCAKIRAIEAVPFIVKGDREYHIPNMKPLKIPQVDVDASENLKVKFTDLKIYGLEDAEIRDVKIDPVKMNAEIQLYFDKIYLVAHYKVKGKILILPIEGDGPANITFSKPLFTYNFGWDFKTKRGVTYAHITDHRINYVLDNAHFHLENLFNGDQKLGAEMNRFLNENWDAVNKDLGSAISETVSAVCTSIATGFFDNVPYDELFLA